jgi:hypothetical protein
MSSGSCSLLNVLSVSGRSGYFLVPEPWMDTVARCTAHVSKHMYKSLWCEQTSSFWDSRECKPSMGNARPPISIVSPCDIPTAWISFWAPPRMKQSHFNILLGKRLYLILTCIPWLLTTETEHRSICLHAIPVFICELPVSFAHLHAWICFSKKPDSSEFFILGSSVICCSSQCR